MNMLRRKPKMPEVSPFDVRTLEEEISEVMRLQPYIPPAYIEPEPVPEVTAEDLGRITAEAIKQAHEAAAQSLESLGKDLIDMVNRVEKIKLQALAQLEELKELAEQQRDAGKLMSIKVEGAANDLSNMRTLIDDMRDKIKQ